MIFILRQLMHHDIICGLYKYFSRTLYFIAGSNILYIMTEMTTVLLSQVRGVPMQEATDSIFDNDDSVRSVQL